MLRRCGLWTGLLVLCGSFVVGHVGAKAAEIKKPLKPGEFNPADQTIDLFEAIKAGQVEAKMIHKDSSGGKVLITNKSAQALNLKLPEVFAGVNVLAQMGMGGGGMGGGGMAQSTGGGMGGGGMGGGMGGGGGGMFNVAPEKVGEIRFTSVCLEHGKPEPRSSMHYELRPIENVASKPEVIETLKLLNRGQMSQRVAQVLAWHLNNEMSFEELAAKQIKHLGGESEPYFTIAEIQAAVQAKQYIAKQLEEQRLKGGEAPVLPKL